MDIKQMVVDDVARAGAFLALYAVIFLLAKWAKDLTTSYNLDEELTQKDNLAICLTTSGYYFGIMAVFVGVLFGPTTNLINDLTLVGEYSLLGILFLNISRVLNDKIILRKFCNMEQLSKEENLSVGAVQFSVYVATGLIAAGALSGQGGGVLSAIAFFALGQLSLFLFSFIYDLLTPYSIHEELEKKNTAAGVAFGGTLIALGIIILNGVSGDFINWTADIKTFAIVNVTAFIFLPIVRIIMDRLVIPGRKLSDEILEDQNIGAGILEATVAISFAAILVQVI